MAHKLTLILSTLTLTVLGVFTFFALTSEPGASSKTLPAKLSSSLNLEWQRKELGSVEPIIFAQSIRDHEPVILDIRHPELYQQGYIPGAINLDYQSADFVLELDQLERDQYYAIYCRSGRSSLEVLELMNNLGFSEVVELSGGMNAWRKAEGIGYYLH